MTEQFRYSCECMHSQHNSDCPLAGALTLRGAQVEITAWADGVFADRTVRGTLAKLMCEELPEFITTNLRDPLEYADLLILVLDLAGQMGIDIEAAFREKMSINRKRSWTRDPDTGFYNHVKEAGK